MIQSGTFYFCIMQVRNPDGREDRYRRWWGYEGGTSTLASKWHVRPELMAGLRSQPRLGAASSVDVFVDMPQPLACLTVRSQPNHPKNC